MSEWHWDKEGNDIVENFIKKLLPTLLQRVEVALSETLRFAKYFISFSDLSRLLLSKLEEHVRLSDKEKEFLLDELKKIYKKTHDEVIKDFPIKPQLTMIDERTINYALRLHDFYLGKFFQGDKQLRLDLVKWMSKYYLEEGNPIGRGQKGIKEFLDKFGDYLKQRTENKARQIIDTSVNHLRNSARLRAMAKAKIQKYRWDAVGDRLTCPYCRSMDGRIFDTGEAIRTLELIETDPSVLPQVKPFLTTMPLDKLKTTPSSRLPSKMPPAHPCCRCRVVAYIEEIEEPYPVVVERAHQATPESEPLFKQLETEFKSLTPREITEKIKAHLGSDWRRQSEGKWDEEKKRLLDHYKKHAERLGISSLKEYERLTYEIIKYPDRVYVQKTFDPDSQNIETDYIFVKGRNVVVSSDDGLFIKSCHRLLERYNDIKERFAEDAKKYVRATIRIL